MVQGRHASRLGGGGAGQQAPGSSIPPLIRFAQRLRLYRPGILGHCRRRGTILC